MLAARSATSDNRILLVEDEAVLRELAAENLLDAGFSVMEAGDGTAGLEALRSDIRIDVLLSDEVVFVQSALETFIAGPVERSSATESGSVTSATRGRMPIICAAVSIAGKEASDERVEIATACGPIIAFAKRPALTRPTRIASG